MQVSQLNELLVMLGHEADAGKLQAALDALAKAFIPAAEEVLSTPSPPANGTDAAASAAAAMVREMHHKLYELSQARWKWEILRSTET